VHIKNSSDILSLVASRVGRNALYDGFARVAKALGNGHRLELVDVLGQGERSVDDLAREIGESVANTSQHLQILARAGLVRSQRGGTRVVYRLAGDDVTAAWAALRDLAARHLAEVEVLATEYVGARDGVERIGADELAARLAGGRVVLLDVRPAAEYAAGHIDGAQSAPLETLTALAPTLPRRAGVVAYCRGPYCVYADDAVRLLRAQGVRAKRLDVGFPEWRRAGLPVAPGE
jgi:rhodanese-related sulfurtransferase/DNA-binding MarR family transcriptional regulator